MPYKILRVFEKNISREMENDKTMCIQDYVMHKN